MVSTVRSAALLHQQQTEWIEQHVSPSSSFGPTRREMWMRIHKVSARAPTPLAAIR